MKIFHKQVPDTWITTGLHKQVASTFLKIRFVPYTWYIKFTTLLSVATWKQYIRFGGFFPWGKEELDLLVQTVFVSLINDLFFCLLKSIHVSSRQNSPCKGVALFPVPCQTCTQVQAFPSWTPLEPGIFSLWALEFNGITFQGQKSGVSPAQKVKAANNHNFVTTNVWTESEGHAWANPSNLLLATLTMWILCLLGQKNACFHHMW